MNRPVPHTREVTPRIAPSAWNAYLPWQEFPEHILRSEGYALSGAGSLYDLYDEMEEKDAHLFAVLQTRKNGILRCPREVAPASESPRDLEVAAFVRRQMEHIPRFEQSLMHILDALGKGLSVQEVLWESTREGVGIRGLRSRAPGRFLFTRNHELTLNPEHPANFRRPEDHRALSRPVPLPERKFLVFTFGGLYENGYGMGLCARAYWYYWFKKSNTKYWVIFNEKFGSPTVIGKYRPGASDDDRDRLFEVIESLQNDTGVTVPESVTLELLEAQRSGNVSTYRELAGWCNAEISKLVLGATLTSDEGQRGGSLALAKVHEQVRSEYIDSDARALEDVINGQLVRWLVDFNFGPDVPAPRWKLDTSRDDALQQELALDRELVQLGVALPKRYFYEKYGRPLPQPDEAILSHDDQNLFQYHLQLGVVTINEARERLGLEAVTWGDRPVARSDEQKVALAGLSAPGSEGPVEESAENEQEQDADA